MLATAYQIGASRASAQAGGLVAAVAHTGTSTWNNLGKVLVVTQAGDLYVAPEHGPGATNVWTFHSNVFGGPTTSVPEMPASTLSDVKEKYRED